MPAHLAVKISSLTFKNPIILASGTFGLELKGLIDLNRLGGVVTKTITLKPRAGNPPPRLAETPAGIINSIGLENPGLDAFCQDYLPVLKRLKTVRIVSIAGETKSELHTLARTLNRLKGIDALELNISCPNVKKGGLTIGTSTRLTKEVVRAVRKATKLPLMVKLTPNVTDIVKIARAAVAGGADIISLINTLKAMSIDFSPRLQPEADPPRAEIRLWRRRERKPAVRLTGGLSGPAIKPIALRMVWEVARSINLPIIGIGGIMTAEDVMEFMVAGARAVQIGTATLIDPVAPIKILTDLKKLLAREHINALMSFLRKQESSL